MLYKLCSCMHYKKMNSISFKLPFRSFTLLLAFIVPLVSFIEIKVKLNPLSPSPSLSLSLSLSSNHRQLYCLNLFHKNYTYIYKVTYYTMLYKLCSCMHYKKMNSISFKLPFRSFTLLLAFIVPLVSFIEIKVKLKLSKLDLGPLQNVCFYLHCSCACIFEPRHDIRAFASRLNIIRVLCY